MSDLTTFTGKDGRVCKLTEKQMTVVELSLTTDMTMTEIAEAAGYAQGESGRCAVWKTLQKDHVQEYMMDQVRKRMGSILALKSTRVLETLLGANSERIRMETAQDLLDRVGARAPERKQVHHTGGVNINIDLG